MPHAPEKAVSSHGPYKFRRERPGCTGTGAMIIKLRGHRIVSTGDTLDPMGLSASSLIGLSLLAVEMPRDRRSRGSTSLRGVRGQNGTAFWVPGSGQNRFPVWGWCFAESPPRTQAQPDPRGQSSNGHFGIRRILGYAHFVGKVLHQSEHSSGQHTATALQI